MNEAAATVAELVERVSPKAKPADSLTMEQHVAKCYEADVLRSRGEDYATVSAAFAAALAEDGNMKTAAREQRDALKAVNAKRGNRDHITSKKIMYLTDALGG